MHVIDLIVKNSPLFFFVFYLVLLNQIVITGPSDENELSKSLYRVKQIIEREK